MKAFDISDVLSITTGRLVSNRHMDGIYDILNFLTGDNLFTHELPRAMKECEPWIRSQFPTLMNDSRGMEERLKDMDNLIKVVPRRDPERLAVIIADWVERLRIELGLPERLAVYELGADMHTHIDPIEEAEAMMGDKEASV